MTDRSLPTEAPPDRRPERRWLAVAAVMLAVALDMIDTTVVNVALPSIERDLGASQSALQWTVAAYTLTFALFLITAGRLGDMLGRRRMLLIGIALFVAASAWAGLSQDPSLLVWARVLQGVGAALLMTQALSVFQVMFPPKERGAVFALFGALTGLSAVLGPLLGGLLIKFDVFGLEWRAIFLINIPLGLLALVGAALWVPESRAVHARRLDVVGVVLVTAGLLALLYPLIKGQELGWPAWTFVSMAAAVPVLVVFAFHQRWKARRDGSALVEPTLFRDRRFVAGLLVLLTFFGGMAGFFFPFTFFLQFGLGYSALHAGMGVLAFSIGAMVTSSFSTQLSAKIGRTVLSIGMLVMAAGIAALVLIIDVTGDSVTAWKMVPALTFAGFGLGLVVAPVVEFVLAGVPREASGSASGVLNTADQLGAAAGVAVIGVLFFGLLGTQSGPAATDVAGELRGELTAAGVAPAAVDGVLDHFRACVEDSSTGEFGAEPPARCQAMLADPAVTANPGVIGGLLAAAGAEAQEETFRNAVERVLLYDCAIILVGFLATFLLPPKPRPIAEALGDEDAEKTPAPVG
jgi:EmrB/QacA subfamily drug resistance transporter